MLHPIPTHKGVQASPDALKAACKTNATAKAKLKKDNHWMVRVAKSEVASSRPKTPAMSDANTMPNTAISNESKPAKTIEAIVTRLASS